MAGPQAMFIVYNIITILCSQLQTRVYLIVRKQKNLHPSTIHKHCQLLRNATACFTMVNTILMSLRNKGKTG